MMDLVMTEAILEVVGAAMILGIEQSSNAAPMRWVWELEAAALASTVAEAKLAVWFRQRQHQHQR